jgi:hypothetical protein
VPVVKVVVVLEPGREVAEMDVRPHFSDELLCALDRVVGCVLDGVGHRCEVDIFADLSGFREKEIYGISNKTVENRHEAHARGNGGP